MSLRRFSLALAGVICLLAACNAEKPADSTPAATSEPPPSTTALPTAPVDTPVDPVVETPPPPAAGKIRVGQILVPWKGAAGAESSVSRTKEQARARAGEALTALRGGSTFPQVVKSHGEGPTARHGGILGEFRAGELAEPYGSAVFALQPGQGTEPMESPMGWQVLVRVP